MNLFSQKYPTGWIESFFFLIYLSNVNASRWHANFSQWNFHFLYSATQGKTCSGHLVGVRMVSCQGQGHSKCARSSGFSWHWFPYSGKFHLILQEYLMAHLWIGGSGLKVTVGDRKTSIIYTCSIINRL